MSRNRYLYIEAVPHTRVEAGYSKWDVQRTLSLCTDLQPWEKPPPILSTSLHGDFPLPIDRTCVVCCSAADLVHISVQHARWRRRLRYCATSRKVAGSITNVPEGKKEREGSRGMQDTPYRTKGQSGTVGPCKFNRNPNNERDWDKYQGGRQLDESFNSTYSTMTSNWKIDFNQGVDTLSRVYTVQALCNEFV
jgi:hypothetical protein